MALSPKQLAVLRDKMPGVILTDGSIRSGKTMSTGIKWLDTVHNVKGDGLIVMTGRTLDTLQRNVLQPLQAITPTGVVQYTSHASQALIMGRVVHLIGMNDKRAEEKIRGMTIEAWYGDEVSTYPELAFTQMLGRMSVTHPIALLTTNPEGRYHWLKTGYLDRLDTLPHWRRYHFTMDDNPTLSPEYVAARKAEFTGAFYKRMIEGLWVAAEGTIFDAFDPETHVTPWAELPPISEIFGVGIDYGTTNPTRAVMLGITHEPNPRLAVISEYAYNPAVTQRRLTDAEQCSRYLDWLRTQHHPAMPATDEPYTGWTIIDPSAASFKQELRAQGVRNIVDADNSVLDGIRRVGSLLARNKIIIADTCTDLIREFDAYVWDSKAAEKGTDAPVKRDDHSLDALRYVINRTRNRWGQHIKDTK